MDSPVKQVENRRDEKGRMLPGSTANPNGRPPKGWTWADCIREAAEEVIDGKQIKKHAAKALVKEVLKGNVPAIKEFGDRIDGKAKDHVDVTSAGEKVSGFLIQVVHAQNNSDTPEA